MKDRMLFDILNNCGTDALLISSYSDCLYYSRYMDPDACILVTCDKIYYYTDDRYVAEAKCALPSSFELVALRSNDYNAIAHYASRYGLKTLGIDQVSFADFNAISKAFSDVEILDKSAEISAPRAVKRLDEIDLIATAARANDIAFENVLGQIKEGMTELELAYLLQYEYVKAGGEGVAFDTISVFGERTAYPHGHPSHVKLKYGDCITLDFGTKFAGYCSDITRSFCFGSADPEYVKVYNAVLEANLASIEAVEAGKRCCEVDDVARNVLKKLDLDKYFTHSLGHGVGIDIHEHPYLSPMSKDVFVENQVYTIEPGVYINGRFGIRIEDMLFVKNGKSETLSRSNKQLIIL